MMPSMTVGSVLKKSLDRLKRQNPAFSLRGLAGKIGVSPAFLSQVFNDRTALPAERLKDLVHHLKIDALTEKSLKRAMIRSLVKRPDLSIEEVSQNEPVKDYTEAAEKDFPLMRDWYLIAILNLATCTKFRHDPAWIAERLVISENEARRALIFLVDRGFLFEKDGRWQVQDRLMRFTPKSSHPVVRNLNIQVLRKAVALLKAAPAQDVDDSRLLTTLSVPANPERIPEAITRRHASLYDIANFLSEGDCTEVFHLSTQLFPATRPKGE